MHHAEDRGWIEGYWAMTETNRKARYYKLTAKGRKQLAEQTSEWEQMARAIGQILHAAEDEQ